MTKVNNIPQNDDVQTHIDTAYELLDRYLPEPYVEKVQNIIPEVSRAVIRKVRSDSGRGKKRLEVLNALVRVALEHKEQFDELKNLTNNNHDNT